MFKKNWLAVLFLALGVSILILGLNFTKENKFYLDYSGVFIGIGSGLISTSIISVFTKFYYKKYPLAEEKKIIEVNDERNVFIRYKACFKAYEISKWAFLGLSVILSFMKFPLWLILCTLCIYIFNAFLQVYFINKYNREN